MNVTDLFPSSKFLKSEDVEAAGGEVTLTISKVERKEYEDEGKKEVKGVLSFSDDEEYKEDYINYVPYVYRINILKKQLTITVYIYGRHFMKTFTFLEFLEMHLSIVQTAIDTLKYDVMNDSILHRYIELIHSERERKRLCERGEFVRNN